MKRLFVGALILLGAFAISGASCGEMKQAPAKTELLGCETVTAELKILLPFREAGKLSKSVLKIVDAQIDLTEPICGGAAPDVNSTVADITVDGAARSLTAVAAQFKTP